MDLSIILVNYNTHDITSKCIASIYDYQGGLELEVILVDNASTDRPARDFLHTFPDLVLIELDENVGFARANNIGMRRGQGEHLLLLNSDTLITDNALEQGLQFMNSDAGKEVDIMGCKLLRRQGEIEQSFYFGATTIWAAFRRGIGQNLLVQAILEGKRKSNFPKRIITVVGISGAFIWLRKSVFEETGGFDPDFFMYCEETEWFRNRLHTSYTTVYNPNLSIYHFSGQSTAKIDVSGQSLPWAQRQNVLSYYLYWWKIGKQKYWAYSITNLMSQAFNVVVLWLLGKRGYHYRSSLLHFKLWKYIWREIPRYPGQFGSRPDPLRLPF